MAAFLSVDDYDPIVETVSRLGEGPISMSTDDVSETTISMPPSVKSPGTFVCKVYAPPTVGTLIILVQRVNYMVVRDRGYTSPHHSLPNFEGNGWSYPLHPLLW